MNKSLLLVSLLFVAGVACNTLDEPNLTEVHELTVSLPKIDSNVMYWKNGDVISAGTNTMSAPLAGVPSRTSSTVFTFEKPVTSGAIVRFPAANKPSSISISSEIGSVTASLGAATFPLYGTVALTGEAAPKVELKSAMSILKFSVMGDATITKATIETVGGEAINGVFNMSASGITGAASNSGKLTEITLENPLRLTANPTDLYIPVPPGTYSRGFYLKLYENSSKYMKVVFLKNSQTLVENSVTSFNFIYSPGFQAEVQPGEDFNSAIVGDLLPDDFPYGKYGVTGTVRYTDGQPAKGIKVSDGFRVVVTDDQGNYGFDAKGKDVRYIYITIPSDAKIKKKADTTCPDFYIPYKEGKYVYDFTLERQPVETEFAFFAFADPQTHYAKRDTQKSADTDRFKNETLPAINAELAKQTLPCYGVCLGDITYSEGNRNSTPSMEIIRGHIGKINMPVFNAMGNHDYTYYKTGASVSTNEGSSTINLLSQRSFEDVFGPINFSFDRGNVHFVCMKDIYFKSTSSWDAGSYTGGFTDEEYNWLVQDLQNTPKNMKVVLCVHIPISTSSGPKISEVKSLLSGFTNSIVFSGHTHYQRAIYSGGKLYEQIHSAVCGQWWWSKIEGDGCPNGYTVHYFNGTDIKNSYFVGVNEGMNVKETCQMRIYKGNLKTGGTYAYFQMPHKATDYLINVFNGDEKWKVKVYENGVYAGTATQMPQEKKTFNTNKGNGYIYTGIPTSSSQDWWATGYHIGVCKRGMGSSTSYYTTNYHMWKWSAKDASAKISVEAEDPYGNVYTSDEVITDGTNYPEYIKAPLTIF